MTRQLASGDCFGAPGASVRRLNTTASIALITFCCMIWFLSIEMCPTPGTLCTSTFSSAPRKSLVRRDGFACPAGDVEIDVPLRVACQLGTEDQNPVRSPASRALRADPRRATISGNAVAPEECPTKIMVRTRPLLYSAAASSASDDQETKLATVTRECPVPATSPRFRPGQREYVQYAAQEINVSARWPELPRWPR